MHRLRRILTDPIPITISLRTKAMLLVGTMAVLLILLLFVLSRIIVLNSFTDLEKDEVTQDTGRVMNAINNDLTNLRQTARDWSQWDDTYQFVQDQNAAYIDENMADDTFVTLDINMMLYFDLSGEAVYAKVFDLQTHEAWEPGPAMVRFYLAVSPSLKDYVSFAVQNDGASGFILTPGGPTMLVVDPILPSDGSGEAPGVLVIGRYLDAARLEQLAQITAVNFQLLNVNDPDLPSDYRDAVQQLMTKTTIVTRPLNTDEFAGYALINDVMGYPRWVMRVEMPREISGRGQDVVWVFVLAAAVVALALIGGVAALIERLVLARLLRISTAINQISQTGNIKGRVPVSGSDELADLGYTINDMLAAFERSQAAVYTSQDQLSNLLNQAEARAVELATVAAISRQITRIFDVDVLPWEASRLIKGLFSFYHVHIYLLEGNTLKLVAGEGEIGRQLVKQGLVIPVDAPKSLVARAARSHEPLLINDVSQEPDFLFNDLLAATRSELAIPMIVAGELVGVMNIEDDQIGRFTLDDAHIQSTLAAQVAIAIHNARLFAENNRRLAIIENTSSLIALADMETYGPLYINPAGLKLLGLEHVEDFFSRPILASYPAEAQVRLNEEAMPAVRTEGLWRGENEILRADGRVTPVEQTIFAIPDKNGQPRDLATIMTDITARRQAEQALRTANRAYRVLSDCNQAMVRATDEDQLLGEVCTIMVSTGHYRFAWVNYLNGTNRPYTMHPAARSGYEEGYLDAIKTLRLNDPDLPPGPSQRAVRSKQPQIVRDISTDPLYVPWREATLARGYRSMIALPLTVDEQPFGSLNIYAAEPNAFDDQEIMLLIELASDLAYGIVTLRTRLERRRALEQLQEANARLEKRQGELLALQEIAHGLISTLDLRQIYEVIYREVAQRLLGAQHLLIALYDPVHEQIVCDFAVIDGVPSDATQLPPMPFGTGPNSETIRTRQPRIVALPTQHNKLTLPGTYIRVGNHGTTDSQSSLYLPLLSGDTVLGVLNIQHNDADAFQDTDMKLLMIVANQAAVAIHNAQLYRAEHHQREFAEALSQLATMLTGPLSLEQVVNLVLDHIHQVVPHDAANIMLIDADERHGYIVGARGYEAHGGKDEHLVPLMYLDDVEAGQAVIINDTTADRRWVDLPQDRWIRAYLGTPIHLGEQMVGILNLDSATPGTFTAAHAARVQAFADQASLAIRSTKLFERVQRHAAELEQRVQERTQEVEQQRGQLQAILDSMGEGVIYDEKLTVKYINRALTQLTGYSPDDFMAHAYLEPLCQSIQPLDEYCHLIQTIYDVVDTKSIWRGESRLQRRDGSVFDAALTVTSVRNTAGQIVGAVTVIRDISQEKALQEQRVRFIANASHELRTPLANIKTRLYLLLRQPEKAEQHHQILSQVADNMAELVENLLDVSRFERGVIPLNRRVTVLQDLVQSVTEIQQVEAENKKIGLEVLLSPVPLRVVVDSRRIMQVINNLVCNAINYTSEGGCIKVELVPEGQQAVLRVSDTGIGIEPDLIAHVFEPFFRADEKATVGTGLGLTIAREIVQLHGGQLTVESTRGQGSVFTMTLNVLAENG